MPNTPISTLVEQCRHVFLNTFPENEHTCTALLRQRLAKLSPDHQAFIEHQGWIKWSAEYILRGNWPALAECDFYTTRNIILDTIFRYALSAEDPRAISPDHWNVITKTIHREITDYKDSKQNKSL